MLDDYSELNWNEIPTRPGLYAFYLNNISLSKIGLYREKTYEREQLILAKQRLITRLFLSMEFIRAGCFVGEIYDGVKKRSIGKTLSIKANEIVDTRIIEKVKELHPEEIIPFVSLLEASNKFNKPIYIGITTKQTLQQRYCQHKSDFDMAKEGTFGGRLSERKISWSDLTLKCVTISPSVSGSGDIVSIVERYFHLVSDPLLSIK